MAARGAGAATPSAGAGASSARNVEAAVFQLTTNVSQYKRLVQLLGTKKDTVPHRARLKQLGDKISALAKEVSAQMKAASAARLEGTEKLKHQKLVKELQTLLKEFQRAQRECAEKESASMPVQKGPRPGAPAASRAEEELQEKQALMAEQRRQEQLQLDNRIEYNDALIEEREQGIVEIQQQIGEVNEIFQDLAVLVNEQGEMIEDIESNIVKTSQQTAAGKKQLKMAEKSQRKLQGKYCCIFAIVGIVMAVLLTVLLTSH